LIELSQDGKVNIEILKAMYGLPQAGILANELLYHILAKDGYRPTPHAHGLCTPDTHPISFSLIVDDFGVKYIVREHAEHLMACIKKNYNISFDWNGLVLIPQVRLAHKYPNSPWEMIHPPGEDNPVRI
jgi:hypothetical protein